MVFPDLSKVCKGMTGARVFFSQVHRLMRRDACSQGAAEARIHAQMPGLQQVQLVKEMLDNRGGREALKHQVRTSCTSWETVASCTKGPV